MLLPHSHLLVAKVAIFRDLPNVDDVITIGRHGYVRIEQRIHEALDEAISKLHHATLRLRFVVDFRWRKLLNVRQVVVIKLKYRNVAVIATAEDLCHRKCELKEEESENQRLQ